MAGVESVSLIPNCNSAHPHVSSARMTYPKSRFTCARDRIRRRSGHMKKRKIIVLVAVSADGYIAR